jgi:hypothetical protein
MKPSQGQFDEPHKHEWEKAPSRPDMIAAPIANCKSCGITSRVNSAEDLNK